MGVGNPSGDVLQQPNAPTRCRGQRGSAVGTGGPQSSGPRAAPRARAVDTREKVTPTKDQSCRLSLPRGSRTALPVRCSNKETEGERTPHGAGSGGQTGVGAGHKGWGELPGGLTCREGEGTEAGQRGWKWSPVKAECRGVGSGKPNGKELITFLKGWREMWRTRRVQAQRVGVL